MLRVRLLGELLLDRDGTPVALTGSWRARSLLAWLALHPGQHPRGDLAARFWPDVLDTSARASLRNALWAIRRALGPEAEELLLATRDRLGLRDPPAVWVDATAFARHLAAQEHEEALALCRGDLLADLGDEWVLEHRDAHRERHAGILETLAVAADAAGDAAIAITWTRRRVALDPLAEDAQRALITRLAASGDRAGALAASARLRDRLRRELGISPSAQTRDLVLAIRQDTGPELERPEAPAADERPDGARSRWSAGTRFPLPPRLATPAPGAFVGRSEELATLREAWDHVRAGHGAHVALVLGEAGMGKTRLARELAHEAAEQGALVLHGTGDEDLLVPHQHFVEALRHYLAVASPEELARRVAPRAADLEPIAPGLAGSPEGARRAGDPAESRRYRLYEAVASLLAEVAADTPILLVLDDLHWADHSSIALLRHVVETRTHLRVLVLATQRPAEADAAAALARAVQRLLGQGLLQRVPLAGLVEADVVELSRSLTGRELTPELAHAIRTEAAGNPFFVQEIVRHLGRAGHGGGVLSLTRGAVPDTIREVVDLRLAPLGGACVRLLTVAAVIGAEFDLEPLERVSDLQGEDLAGALDAARAADLVLELPHGDRERFAFSHALVRRTLLDRLSRAHRRRIHARVAEALEAGRGDDALLEIAHHLCEAVPAADRDHALEYATRAAERATSGLAYDEAVDLFTRALALLPAGHPGRRILALKRALAYQALWHAVMDTGPGVDGDRRRRPRASQG